jgi:hypothetical protein
VRSFANSFLLVIILTLLLGSTGSAVAQQASLTIRCSVMDDITRQYVVRAKVTLSGGPKGDSLLDYTDAQGGCHFTDLPLGRYTLSIEKAGFFSRTPAGVGGFGPLVIPGETAGEVTLPDIILTRMRTISGRIKWQSGDPADHVVAHALMVRRGKASFRSGDAMLAITDERGEFRLSNLKPGRYVVYCYTIGLANESSHKPVAMPVFYPNTPAPETGSAVDLRTVDESSHLLMTLQEAEGSTLGGLVLTSTALPEGSPVQIGLLVPESPAQPFAAVAAQVGKHFKMEHIPPGSYTLVALSTSDPNLRSVQRVRVDVTPVDDLQVAVSELRQITGTVAFDEAVQPLGTREKPRQKPTAGEVAEPATRSAEGISLLLMSPSLQLFGISAARTDKQGAFSIRVFPNESYELNFQPPRDSYISKVSQGTKELTSSPWPIAEGSGPLSIQLKTDGGRLSGRVTDNQGKPSAAFVVLAPRDKSREHLFRTGTADGDGKFTIANIPPGDYTAFALVRNEEDSYLDWEYLRTFERSAERLSVSPGGKYQFELRLAESTGR